MKLKHQKDGRRDWCLSCRWLQFAQAYQAYHAAIAAHDVHARIEAYKQLTALENKQEKNHAG